MQITKQGTLFLLWNPWHQFFVTSRIIVELATKNALFSTTIFHDYHDFLKNEAMIFIIFCHEFLLSIYFISTLVIWCSWLTVLLCVIVYAIDLVCILTSWNQNVNGSNRQWFSQTDDLCLSMAYFDNTYKLLSEYFNIIVATC